MIENVVERAIVPHNPSVARVLNKDKYNLFAPVAGPGKVGMASFDARYFIVRNQEVSLKDGVIPQVIEEPADATDKNVFSAAYILSLSIAIENDLNMLGERVTTAEGDIADNADDIAANAASISRIDTALTAQEDLNRSVERRLNNLEIGTLDTVKQSGEAYAVNVPAEALPWVSVDKIGGKTRVELTETGTTVADGGVTLNGTLNDNPTFYSCNVATDSVDRDNYAVVIDVLGGSYSGGTPDCFFTESYSIGNVLGAKIPNAVGRYVYPVDSSSIKGASFMPENGIGTMTVHAEGVTFNDFRFNITLYEGVVSELVSTPVTSVKTVGKNIVNNDVSDVTSWEAFQESHPTTGTITRYVYPLTLPSDGLFVLSRSMLSLESVYLYIQVSTDGGNTYTETNAALDAAGNPIRGVVASSNSTYETLYINNQNGYKWRLWANSVSTPSKIAWMQIEKVEQLGQAPSSYAPYTERVYSIPEAVQELDGYGDSLPNGLLNYVDPANMKFVREVGKRAYQTGDVNSADMLTDGVTTIYPLASPIVTDLGDDSPALTEDGYLEMEENGWIYLVNENESAVPYSITYQKTKGA